MPVSGSVSNWRIEMAFNHPVSSIQCWKGKPKKLSDDGRKWELTPMSYNNNLDSKFNFDFLAKSTSNGVKATTWWCHDGITNDSDSDEPQPTKSSPVKTVSTSKIPSKSNGKTTPAPKSDPAHQQEKAISSNSSYDNVSYNKASKAHCSRAAGNLKSQSKTTISFTPASKEEKENFLKSLEF